MNAVISLVNFLSNNGQLILNGCIGVLGGLIAISLVVPGDQPEKALQGVLDFLSKFSRKPPSQ